MESRLHKTISVIHPKTKETIEIDVELIVIILLLWKKGYDTIQSCQEISEESPWGKKLGPGYTWIQFLNRENVENFINLVSHGNFKPNDFQYQDNHVHFRKELISKLTKIIIEKDEGITKKN